MKHPNRSPKGFADSRYDRPPRRDVYNMSPQAIASAGRLVTSESGATETSSDVIHLPQDFQPKAYLVDSLVDMRKKAQPVSFGWIVSATLGLGAKKLKRLDRNDREWLDRIRDAAVEAKVYTRIVIIQDNGRRHTMFAPGPMELIQALQSQEFVDALQRPGSVEIPPQSVNAVEASETVEPHDFSGANSEQALADLGITDPADLSHRK